MARIAVPLEGGFEDSELTVPWERLRAAGHEVVILGREAGRTLEGKRGRAAVIVDLASSDADPDDYDALLVPGGWSPDHIRTHEPTVSFVRRFCRSGRPVAAICHGPQLLIEADGVKGRTLTSWPSVRTDLENAGASWVDREVVEEGNLVTSRKPDDLEAFCAALLRRLAEAPAESPQPVEDPR